ncbi:DEAD-domain-containing protein [Laetiporus sulphureus 93-53]|uniref:ATP-dependent RNA helicase n=1 Tax=Laetiporus sulphureus 93-53 TaxID=1314785 RepID=A0A165ERX2_9APHY|nr:DEAD-domain-containing protein [Laetiporus sulphureus 93-53]KZT07643.1 DEAD-domain-containing protein [Laetiporus sulphureus 93-53]
MSLSAAASQPKDQPKSKEKTKAKKRYLKAKKERRKNRKALSGSGRAHDHRASDQRNSDAEGDDDDHVLEREDDEQPEEPSVVEKSRKGDDERPRKRRKLNKHREQAVPSSPEPSKTNTIPKDTDKDDEAMPEEASTSSAAHRSPTPPVALPAFPLPRRPNAPSKRTLALQGLDKALVEAEIVDPATLQELLSTADADGGTRLGEKTRKRLKELGITELFAVQTAVVPFLLSSEKTRHLYLPYDPPRDLCVSAPTGSGKTLAYVLPIVEVLSARIVTRLRALIVLPTRDLVTQVRETFEAIAKGRGLKIGTATGQHSFAHEQGQLIADRSTHLQGGSSKIDILICTPGRLMDHLNGTPNFSLQHLRFLVIDEADRLLAQSFQDWLAQVLAATQPPPLPAPSPSPNPPDLSLLASPSLSSTDPSSFPLPRADALAPAFLHLLDGVPYVRTDVDERRESSCQKLLFSATLTRDPAKIAALGLREPKYFIVQGRKGEGEEEEEEAGVLDTVMEKFSMPATLTEHMLVCESSEKPLMLFHLVHMRGVTNALVFTKSAESTARLVKLFEFFETTLGQDRTRQKEGQIIARAYSSDLSPGERKTILEKFKAQEIHILVCSDLISRGIDISHVSHVVSYDAPVDMRKYVHRVGRTARAGRAGDAWTLVEEQEARYFKLMLKESDHLEKVKRLRVNEKDVAPLQPAYESALGQLKDAYARNPI